MAYCGLKGRWLWLALHTGTEFVLALVASLVLLPLLTDDCSKRVTVRISDDFGSGSTVALALDVQQICREDEGSTSFPPIPWSNCSTFFNSLPAEDQVDTSFCDSGEFLALVADELIHVGVVGSFADLGVGVVEAFFSVPGQLVSFLAGVPVIAGLLIAGGFVATSVQITDAVESLDSAGANVDSSVSVENGTSFLAVGVAVLFLQGLACKWISVKMKEAKELEEEEKEKGKGKEEGKEDVQLAEGGGKAVDYERAKSESRHEDAV